MWKYLVLLVNKVNVFEWDNVLGILLMNNINKVGLRREFCGIFEVIGN